MEKTFASLIPQGKVLAITVTGFDGCITVRRAKELNVLFDGATEVYKAIKTVFTKETGLLCITYIGPEIGASEESPTLLITIPLDFEVIISDTMGAVIIENVQEDALDGFVTRPRVASNSTVTVKYIKVPELAPMPTVSVKPTVLKD
jgi:hypothetical protein